MHITKKIDRAFQWAGEKMGAEAKTTMSEEFKMLETEMALRYDGALSSPSSCSFPHPPAFVRTYSWVLVPKLNLLLYHRHGPPP